MRDFYSLYRSVLKADKEVNFISSAMQGYALLCVGFPSSDIEVETQDEDEVMCGITSIQLKKIWTACLDWNEIVPWWF